MESDSDEYRPSDSEDGDDDNNNRPEDINTRRRPIHNPPSVSPRRGESFTALGSASAGPPPLKRTKGEFNISYLNLLNQDIQDASSGLLHSDIESESESHTQQQQQQQVGMVLWNQREKNIFFSALSRLGQEDISGIAARIGTKSEAEVKQYIMLLLNHGKPSLSLVDIPAASEISPACCVALEQAADALSLRQEGYEEEIEKERWGTRWLITSELARILEDKISSYTSSSSLSLQKHVRGRGRTPDERSARSHSRHRGESKSRAGVREEDGEEEEEGEERLDKDMAFLQLFAVENWLELSNRVFMNSTVSDGNWRAVVDQGGGGGEEEQPAIRATAFADFHSLVVSITRRLVAAVIYIAESRKSGSGSGQQQRRTRRKVRREDVLAAVSSLGMKGEKEDFWTKCARRLQLDVVDDDREEEEEEEDERDESKSKSTTDEDESDDYDIMSYAEVESALGIPSSTTITTTSTTTEKTIPDSSDFTVSSTSSESSSDNNTDEEEQEQDGPDIKMEDRSPGPGADTDDDLDSVAIEQDLEEALTYSTGGAVNASFTRRQIRTEYKLERDAEKLDLQLGADAEARLWDILRNDPDAKGKAVKGKEGERRGRLKRTGESGEAEESEY
ncbi:hypothetical protein GGS20DRAFT_598291 [Poronia punctata]|nr:hypothetical protein GGS20DRAFT_598291 [Poronia punctata]